MLQVYYPRPSTPEIPGRLQALLEDVRVSSELEQVPHFEILIEGWLKEEDLSASPQLRTVIVPFAGVPEPALNMLRSRPEISVHNLHHNAVDTAEVAMSLLLSCAKLIVPLDRKMRKGDWSPRYQPSQSLRLQGKTTLVLGYGEIGRHIARCCLGMGMNVLALRRHATGLRMDGDVEVHPLEGLHGLLPEANALMVALPLTPETIGIIGHKELMLLPEKAILVNIARGPIVDEEALFVALEQGKLHSAGIDVWYQYPAQGQSDRSATGYFDMPESAHHTLPSRFPFQDLANVVMSPHRGGVSADSEPYRIEALAALLRKAAAGEAIPNQVDLEAGY